MADSNEQTEQPQRQAQADAASVGKRAGLMSACVFASRITGFIRTWAMAFALGATALSSSYQVANNLPNMLYELVMGGMLVTAFLPVYISVKRKQGEQAGNAYASNLLTMVTILLGIVSLIGIIFPQAIVYTQSFYSDQGDMATAILLFQFFAIQTVFYGGSSIISGLLNANRDYLWSSIAPIFNNLMVIITFVIYAFVAPSHPTAALYIIAVGNPLGVFAQMVIQIPALRRNGIRLRPRLDIHDPAIRETLGIGIPAMLVMVFSFVTVSVMNAASYCFADDGPSVIAYARLWYTLPYSFLAIPITTALFTELSHLREDKDDEGFIGTIVDGTAQILFLLIPFTLYLIVFSYPLVSLYHLGAFTMERVGQIASYLCALSLALPFYGVSTYLQKAFSSMRKMGVYVAASAIGAAIQVILTCGAASLATHGVNIGIESIGIISAIFYAVADIVGFVYLRRSFNKLGAGRLLRAILLGLALGALGAAAGWGALKGLQLAFGALNGSILQAFAYIVVGGVLSLLVTFGAAVALRLPEASYILSLTDKLTRRLKRS